ncbi:MAG: hypothetical protein D6692_00520 [Planctomycetota bacterium]|nr:MAG: hypothetical protein D6692_00520 [Planctomycetota bacterium]
MIPLDDRSPAAEVLEEHEDTTGWRFRVAITRLDGSRAEHEITLAWVDHDHWTGGSVPPSRLVERLAVLIAERKPDLPPRFDAAKARRWMPELDDLLMRLR